MLKLDHLWIFASGKNNFLNHSIAYVNERSTIKANISKTVRDTKVTRSKFWDVSVFFYSPKFDRNEGNHWMHFACICNTVFRMFSYLQINCQPFYLRQLLKFHQSDRLIEIYLQIEGQGTHHKMVSLQPMSGFPLCCLEWYRSRVVLCSSKPNTIHANLFQIGSDPIGIELHRSRVNPA